MFPRQHERRGRQIDLIQHENHILLQGLGHIVVQGRREHEAGVANVDYHQDDVGHLQNAPQLSPGLQIQLEVAQVLPVETEKCQFKYL